MDNIEKLSLNDKKESKKMSKEERIAARTTAKVTLLSIILKLSHHEHIVHQQITNNIKFENVELFFHMFTVKRLHRLNDYKESSPKAFPC